MNNEGPLSFDAAIDLIGFKRDAATMRDLINAITKSAVDGGKELDRRLQGYSSSMATHTKNSGDRIRQVLQQMVRDGQMSTEQMNAHFKRFQSTAGDVFRTTESQARKALSGISSAAEREANKMSSAFGRASQLLAGYFTFQFAKNAAMEIVKVRGEFQQLQIAFTTMLRSKERADALMSELIQFAATTPFGLKDAANAAKQLLAYGSAAENVKDELRILGDVAAGTSQPIGELVYLYGTLRTQGRAYAVDIRQFAGRGIPIYEELAKVLGIATAEVSKFVEEGKVGFKEVEQAFKNMTNEGGLFGGLMEAQSKSVTGQLERLKDAFDVMLNEIGTNNEGFINGAISTTSTLVENYQTILDILKVLIATYGAYKAVVILTAAAEKAAVAAGNIRAWFELAKGIKTAKDAQVAFNLAASANPWGLAIAGATALAAALYYFAGSQSVAEHAAEDLTINIEQESLTLDIMFDRLKRAEKGTKEYADAKQSIIDKYGAYNKGLSEELEKVGGIETAYRSLAQAVEEATRARLKDQYVSEAGKEAGETIGDAYDEIRKGIVSKLGNEAGGELFRSVKEEIEKGGQWQKLLLERGFKPDSEAAGGFFGVRTFTAQVARITEAKEELKSNLKEIDSIYGIIEKKDEKAAQKISTVARSFTEKLDSANSAFALGVLKHYANTDDQVDGILKKTKELLKVAIQGSAEYKALAKLEASLNTKKKTTSSKTPAPVGSIRYYEEMKQQAEKAITDLSPEKLGMNEFESQRKALNAKIKYAEDSIKKLQGLQFKTYDEELEYRKKQYEQYWKWAEVYGRDSADRQFQDLAEKGNTYQEYLRNEILKYTALQGAAGYPVPELQKRVVVLQEELNTVTGAKSPLDKFKEEADRQKDLAKDLNEYLVYLNKQMEEAKTKNTMEGEQRRKEIQDRINTTEKDIEKERQKEFQRLSEELSGIDKKRQELKKYFDLYKGMAKSTGNTGLLAALSELEAEENKKLDRLVYERSDLFKKMNEDITLFTKEQIKKRSNDVRKILSQNKGIPPIIKKQAEEYIIYLEKLFNDLDVDIPLKERFSKGATDASNLASALSSMSDAVAEFNSELSWSLSQLSSMTNIASSAAGAASAFQNKDISGGISQSMNAITAFFQLLDQAKKSIKETREEINRFNNAMYDGEFEINALYRERARLQAQISAEGLKGLQAQTSELRKQKKEIEGQANALLAELQKQNYVLSEEEKKQNAFGGVLAYTPVGAIANLFGIGRRSTVDKQTASLVGKTYEEIEQLYIKGQLEERAKQLFEQLRKLKEEGMDIDAQLADLKTQMQEVFTGTTAETISSSIRQGLAEGKRSVADFAQDVEKFLQDALLSGFEARAIQPMIDELYQQFADMAESDGGLDASEAEAFRDAYNNAIAALGTQFDLLKDAAGIDFGANDPSTRQSVRGEVKSLSEQTGGAIEGQMNAIRINQVNGLQKADAALGHLAKISANSDFLPYLHHLENMDKKITSQYDILKAKGII